MGGDEFADGRLGTGLGNRVGLGSYCWGGLFGFGYECRIGFDLQNASGLGFCSHPVKRLEAGRLHVVEVCSPMWGFGNPHRSAEHDHLTGVPDAGQVLRLSYRKIDSRQAGFVSCSECHRYEALGRLP